MAVFYTHPLLGRAVTAQSMTASACRDSAFLMATVIQLRTIKVQDGEPFLRSFRSGR